MLLQNCSAWGKKKAYQIQALLPSGAYFAAQNIHVAVRSRIDLGECVRGGGKASHRLEHQLMVGLFCFDYQAKQ